MLREREYRQNEMFRGVLLHARATTDAPGVSVLVCVAFVPDAGHISLQPSLREETSPVA